jgi:tetratricopeptide (TPR) repeat protein
VLGQLTEGLNCLDEAERIIATTDERYNEAELYRSRGELQIAAGDQVAAEQNYHRALDVAQRQSAKILNSVPPPVWPGLWCEQDMHVAARDLLAPTYNWFTEGLDTPVLKGAKVLLDQLSA